MEADKVALENERWYSGVLRDERDAARTQVERLETALRKIPGLIEDPDLESRVIEHVRAALSTEEPSEMLAPTAEQVEAYRRQQSGPTTAWDQMPACPPQDGMGGCSAPDCPVPGHGERGEV